METRYLKATVHCCYIHITNKDRRKKRRKREREKLGKLRSVERNLKEEEGSVEPCKTKDEGGREEKWNATRTGRWTEKREKLDNKR